MNDQNTQTQSSNNPQDLIDQALGTTRRSPAVTPDPSQTTAEPTMPTPEPLTPPLAPEPVVEQKAEEEVALPTSEPAPLPEPPTNIRPMNEDIPLAFASSEPQNVTNSETLADQVPPLKTVDTVVPPATIGLSDNQQNGKKKSNKIMIAIIGFFAFLGVVSATGYYAYNRYGTVDPATIAIINDRSKDDCQGCVNGGWLVWRNGECKHTGICDSGKPGKDTEPPDAPPGVDAATYCSAVGGQWCSGVYDANGNRHDFCGKTDQACYQSAIDEGITMRIGVLQCISKEGYDHPQPDEAVYNKHGNNKDSPVYGGLSFNDLEEKCKTRYSDIGTVKFICKIGVEGGGGEIYNGGPCNKDNGKPFYGNELGCFCGTIQVDRPDGHTSYRSTCGCEQEEKEIPSPSPSASVSTASLMCSNLTRTPTAVPEIGDKLTFTCAGASTPAGAVNLTYKFRYNLNNGAYVAMTNKTATTSELTIASCGTYKVQCQACGTINGVLTCDPTWTAATQ
ncbi:MAG: hypothetical protein Fur0011_1080 [Candidatus Microgenomates bacterium]